VQKGISSLALRGMTSEEQFGTHHGVLLEEEAKLIGSATNSVR
jgi:hypothetical protein